jgi:hypothetical protein
MLRLKEMVCLKLRKYFLFAGPMKANDEESDQKDHEDRQTDDN